MKKKLLTLASALFMVFAVSGCNNTPVNPDPGPGPVVTDEYTVAFEVEGARWKTVIVEAGSTIDQEIGTPAKEGYDFVGWFIGEEEVDLSTYVVTGNVTLVAHFEEKTGPVLSVDDVKEEGASYYLVLGWWETTAFEEDGVTPKITSSMNRDTTRLFYANVIKYLKAIEVSDANIARIQFRNYSTEKVGEMGEMINADADVDLMVGVGKNINSDAHVNLYDNNNNDYKFTTEMGTGPKSRYVACLSTASEQGVALYTWLKKTDAGKAAFLRELTDEEIAESLIPEAIELTVTVHGDTDETTTLTDENTVVTMPTITVADDKIFKGFALTQDGEVVLSVSAGATLKYEDLKDLVAEGATTLDLYPVFEDKPVVLADLVVYIQTGSRLPAAEASLLEARFAAAHPDKELKFVQIDGNADAFVSGVGADADVLIGGNDPVGKTEKFGAHADGPVANAGNHHFQNTSRKIIIRDSVAVAHLDLAKELYNFVVADATLFEVHATFWSKDDNTWTTEEERNTMSNGIRAHLNTLMSVTGDDNTLESVYNISLEFATVADKKVADCGASTRALRDGKGTDLIIGCGGNVASTGGMTLVKDENGEDMMKSLGAPFFSFEGGRNVALITENFLTLSIYNSYFVEAQA